MRKILLLNQSGRETKSRFLREDELELFLEFGLVKFVGTQWDKEEMCLVDVYDARWYIV